MDGNNLRHKTSFMENIPFFSSIITTYFSKECFVYLNKVTTLPINDMIVKVKDGIMRNIQNTGVEIIDFPLVQTVPKYCWVPMSYYNTFDL